MHLYSGLFPALRSFRLRNALKAFFSLAVGMPQLVIHSTLQDSGLLSIFF